MPGTKTVYVYVPEDVAERWKQQAKQRGLSVSGFVQEQVEKSLEKPGGIGEPNATIVKLEEEASKLKSQTTELKETNQMLETQLKSLEAEQERLAKTNQELQVQIKALKEENSKLRAENEKLRRGTFYFKIGGKKKK